MAKEISEKEYVKSKKIVTEYLKQKSKSKAKKGYHASKKVANKGIDKIKSWFKK